MEFCEAKCRNWLNRFDHSQRTVEAGSPATNAGIRLDAIGNTLWMKDVCPTDADCYKYHGTKKRAVWACPVSTYAALNWRSNSQEMVTPAARHG